MSRRLVAITGGCGFIGRHLARAVSLAGWRTRLIDTALPESRAFPWGLGGVADWEFARGDVTDREGLSRILTDAEAIVHLAGISVARVCQDRPLEAFRVNALGTANVVDAGAATGARRVVLASSRHVEVASEAGWLDVYAASKAVAETWVRATGHVVTRFDNVYGPGQAPGAVIPDFIVRGLAGGYPYGHPKGETVPLLFVEDAVDAVLRLLTAAPAAGVYRVRAPEEAPLSSVAAVVAALIQKKSSPPLGPGVARAGDPALAALGWRPRVGWPEGVRRTFEEWPAEAAGRP